MKYDYPINILLIYERSENLTDLVELLENENYNVIHAFSSEEALICITKDEFALIVLDIKLRGFEGFETAKLIKVREKSISTPIIFITDKDHDINHLFTGYSIGAIDYMVKPFIPQLLKSKIDGFISMYDAKKKLQLQTKLLMRSEAQARIIGETSIDTMVIFNSEGLILNVNPAVYKMFGFHENELEGYSICKLLPMISTHTNELFKIHENYLTNELVDVILKHKDETSIDAEIQVGQAIIEDSLIFACTISDMTDRKKAERAMKEAKEEAERASRVKTDFLAIMSHEIRTPMNGIIGMTDLLIDSGLSDVQLEYAVIVHKSSNALLHIINDVLDFSKIESGMMVLEQDAVDLQSLIEETFDLFKATTKENNLRMEYQIDPNLPLCIMSDATRLQQILINLVGNAVKFTEKGSIQVNIDLLKREESDLEIKFIVKDTGIGIAPHQVVHLFKPFSQLDSSMTRKYGGTGLGLAICKTLVELMGGNIQNVQDSDNNSGATFAFTIRTKALDIL